LLGTAWFLLCAKFISTAGLVCNCTHKSGVRDGAACDGEECVFNVGTGHGTSLTELVHLVEKLAQKTLIVEKKLHVGLMFLIIFLI